MKRPEYRDHEGYKLAIDEIFDAPRLDISVKNGGFYLEHQTPLGLVAVFNYMKNKDPSMGYFLVLTETAGFHQWHCPPGEPPFISVVNSVRVHPQGSHNEIPTFDAVFLAFENAVLTTNNQ